MELTEEVPTSVRVAGHHPGSDGPRPADHCDVDRICNELLNPVHRSRKRVTVKKESGTMKKLVTAVAVITGILAPGMLMTGVASQTRLPAHPVG